MHFCSQGLNGLVTALLGLTAISQAFAAPSAHNARLSRRGDGDSAGALRSPAAIYNNTLIPQRADPQILKHFDGYYYFIATVPAYDRVVLRRAPTIQELSDAEEVVIFTAYESSPASGQVWAPELHRIGDKWYVYVALGVAGAWEIRSRLCGRTRDGSRRTGIPFLSTCTTSRPRVRDTLPGPERPDLG